MPIPLLNAEKPWLPQHTITPEIAHTLIESQFPELVPVSLISLGEGWDNTVYQVNQQWLFRFPRREMALPLLETERLVLPFLAGQLPVAVPEPCFEGQPQGDYPWPFLGYRLVVGQTACRAELSVEQRLACAAPLAAFLKALHRIDLKQAMERGLPADQLDRVNVPLRAQQTRERLQQLQQQGVLPEIELWLKCLEEAQPRQQPLEPAVVHGDLYARHLVLDPQGQLTGVIDWGDLHYGDIGLDLAIVFGFLPASARLAFFEVYGEISAETENLARFRALYSAVAIVLYGHDVGDQALFKEGLQALEFVLS